MINQIFWKSFQILCSPSLNPSLDLNENVDIPLLIVNGYIKQGWGVDLGFSTSLCYTLSRILH